MCVTVSAFMGDVRQAVGLLKELRYVIQRQQESKDGCPRDGDRKDGSASARGYKSIPLP